MHQNTEKINRLFRRAEGWDDAFLTPTYSAFDEAGWWVDSTSTYSDVPFPGKARPSMTGAVRSAEAEGLLRWHDEDACQEFGIQRRFRLQWSPSGLEQGEGGRPLAFYHLVPAKNDRAFRTPSLDPSALPELFEVTRRGIREPSESRLVLDVTWAARKGACVVNSAVGRVWGGVARRLATSLQTAANVRAVVPDERH